MAIDSAAKRRSAAGVGFFLLGPGVTPDATPDQFWRQSAAWSYGGILAGEAVAPVATGNQIKHITQRAFGHKAFEYWRTALGARKPWPLYGATLQPA